MQASIEVFKSCLSNLSIEDKARVEIVVRKYIPKRQENDDIAKNQKEGGDGRIGSPSSAAAPQIQLKLKFG